MRVHLMALAVLGMWLGMTVLMWVVAAGSFSTVERVLRAPPRQLTGFAERFGPEPTRALLRYIASETNRTAFRAYGWGQIALAALLLFLIRWRASRDTTALVIIGVMVGLVLALTLVITPEIVAVGRRLDFLPRNPPPAEMPRFRTLHAAFTGLDSLKFLAGLVLLYHWTFGRGAG